MRRDGERSLRQDRRNMDVSNGLLFVAHDFVEFPVVIVFSDVVRRDRRKQRRIN